VICAMTKRDLCCAPDESTLLLADEWESSGADCIACGKIYCVAHSSATRPDRFCGTDCEALLLRAKREYMIEKANSLAQGVN
jgi:hypothetical protein